ncbi:MAG: cache domain-containing protein, partial [Cyanobacteria bacterium J06576_12]
MTIRWTLPIYIVVPLVSGIALTSWLAFRNGQMAVEELVDDISTEVASNIEKQVSSYLDRPALVSAAISTEVAGDNLDTDDVRLLSTSLWQFTQSSLLVNNLYYGSETGEFVYSENQYGESRLDFVDRSTEFKRVTYRTDAAGNLGDSRTLNNYDPRERPWYRQAAADKAPVWSPVYIANSRDDLTLTRATPVFDEANRLQGVFGIDIYLNELSDFMRKLTISPNGRAFIIETSGELIASSANEKPFLEQGDTKLRMSANNSQDPLIRETAIHLSEQVINLQNITGRETIEFELEGETQLAYIYRFQDIGVDWLLGIVIPQNDYMETITDNAQRTILIGIGITITVSLLSLVAALHIIHPIRKLNCAADDIK